jgi:hypothetical protein
MTPKKVTLIKCSNNFQLFVDSSPFYIKGAGLELGSIARLAEFGGNAFRTRRVNNGDKTGLQILDEAQACGLMVCMGLEVARERHGFDYNNASLVEQQLQEIKRDVDALKDHPALLMWGIGNELNLRHKNSKVWDAVNAIAKMIHQIDPNHPTTTMLAGADPEVIKQVVMRASAVDLLSFQLYGDIDKLPKYLAQSNYQGAYTVSEWGATGHWEAPKTKWGRPIEANSTEKANDYRRRYVDYIVADTQQCIGSFVFLWGQKQERTPTWYGVFLDNGRYTQAAQVMSQLWTGIKAKQPVPEIKTLRLQDIEGTHRSVLKSGHSYTATLAMNLNDKHLVSYRWVLMHEVDITKQSEGGDFEPIPKVIWQQEHTNTSDVIEFKAPQCGEYRLFVYADDSFGGSATANMPVLVDSIETT